MHGQITQEQVNSKWMESTQPEDVANVDEETEIGEIQMFTVEEGHTEEVTTEPVGTSGFGPPPPNGLGRIRSYGSESTLDELDDDGYKFVGDPPSPEPEYGWPEGTPIERPMERPMERAMERVTYTRTAVSTGISMGTALAIILSYSVNKSILWAIIHGILSWLYVLYFALFK